MALADGEPQELPAAYIALGPDRPERARDRVTRDEMGEFALVSQQRTPAATPEGVFDREITPLALPTAASSKPESPRQTVTLEGLAGLKSVFRPDGQVSAGNS